MQHLISGGEVEHQADRLGRIQAWRDSNKFRFRKDDELTVAACYGQGRNGIADFYLRNIAP